MEKITTNLSGSVRAEKLAGREYLVAPATLIVSGVLNGSLGPLLYPEEELSQKPWSWNNLPIIVYHPFKKKSARSPEVINQQGIGHVFNAHFADGKLRAELWFDVERTKELDPRVLNALSNGEPMELSTGLGTHNEKVADGSTFNGVPYTHIARNYEPDHLAILPDQVGACSLKDGCGTFNLDMSQEDLRGALQDLLAKRFPGEPAIEPMDLWIGDIYSSYFIFHKSDGLFRMGYSIENEKPRLSDEEPQKVQRKTVYEITDNYSKQPRDRLGQFASTGSGGGGGGAAGGGDSVHGDILKAQKKLAKEMGFEVQEEYTPPPRNATETWKKSQGYANTEEGDIAYLDQGTPEAVKIHVKTVSDDIKNGRPGVSGVVLDHKNAPVKEADGSLQQRWAYADQVGQVYKKPKAGGKSADTMKKAKNSVNNTDTENQRRLEMTSDERKAVIDGLIENSCCWEETDRKELESLTDNQLQKTQVAAQKAAENEELLAAAEKGFNDGREAVNFNREKRAWEKSQQGKGESMSTENKQLTKEEWLKMAPDDEARETFNFAQDAKNREKQELIGKILFNVSADEKPKQIEYFSTKSIDELRRIAAVMPDPAENRQPDFYGPATVPARRRKVVENSRDGVVKKDEDLEMVPQEIDWAENSAFKK